MNRSLYPTHHTLTERGAAAAFADLLTDRERVPGPDHPDTLTTRNNLAHRRARNAEGTTAVD